MLSRKLERLAPMKIWFPVIRGNSGTDVFTRRLADGLRRYGVTTEITWFPGQYELFPKLLARYTPPLQTDIIHANSWFGSSFHHSGIPLVVTEHQGVYSAQHRCYRNTIQRIYHTGIAKRRVVASIKTATVVTTVSHFAAHGMKTTLGIRPDQVIHNWINTNLFKPPPDMQRRSTPFRLIFVGNPTWLKGADLLTLIMRRLGSDFELHFTSGLKNLKFSNSSGNISSLGRIDNDEEMVRAYQQSDAALLPTRFESFGYAALEAMACGKPVIASRVAAVPEVVEDGKCGILCPAGNVDAFVDACLKLANNESMRVAYGTSARSRATTLFSEEQIIPQYVELYESILSKRDHP